jgi:hypothetical protein
MRTVKLFDDPTPDGIICQRFVPQLLDLSKATDFSNEEANLFLRILILVAKKLGFVWKHKSAFQDLEKKLVHDLTARGEKGEMPQGQDASEDLFMEFDEFLVQVKSTLDYLVKIPIPIFGKNRWPLVTFGEKGDRIRKLLRNLPKQYHANAAAINTRLLQTHKDWLHLVIEARDKQNHFIDGGIPFEYFGVFWDRSKPIAVIHTPRWSEDMSVTEFMDIIWSNLFRFCERFVGYFLFFRIKPEVVFFHGSDDISSLEAPWKVVSKGEMDRYEKAGLLTKVEGSLDPTDKP